MTRCRLGLIREEGNTPLVSNDSKMVSRAMSSYSSCTWKGTSSIDNGEGEDIETAGGSILSLSLYDADMKGPIGPITYIERFNYVVEGSTASFPSHQFNVFESHPHGNRILFFVTAETDGES